MADRVDYFYRMRLSEAELDLGFELLERADRNLAADIGVRGIISGAEPAPHSPVADLTIDLTAPARAYDRLGQRIFFGTGQRVDCSADYTGVPTEVTAAGKERWLGVFLKFDRLLSDPRTDGNSQQVYFRRDESFRIFVRQGPEGPTGAALRVPLQDDELLVCDILRRQGQTQITAADIRVWRRQVFVFASADAISTISKLWKAIAPARDTVQAALDSVDNLLAGHLGSAGTPHSASQVTYTPHGFVTSTKVQNAIDEIVDDLSASTSGSPGAMRVGADAVPGTPNALPAGTVDGQLSQLLAAINSHVAAPSGAHSAAAIAAAAHNYIASGSVQAQLQDIVSLLLSKTAGASGATRIGAEAITASPISLTAGTVAEQLRALLGLLNTQAHAGAPGASAIAVSDPADNLSAANVEDALAEILGTYAADHFRGNEASPGMHKAIRQPLLGQGPEKVLLWEAQCYAHGPQRFRVYLDGGSVWFTVNAASSGTQWVRDAVSYQSGGFCFSAAEFQVVNDRSQSGTFTTWTRTWTLPLAQAVNSAFETTGTIQEVGRLGLQAHNTHTAARTMSFGGSVTFRSRFPAAPSSITFASASSKNFHGSPTVLVPDRDGFAFQSTQDVPPGDTSYWFGSYTAFA